MKVLYFLIGAPGTGKTTFLETMSKDIYGDNELLRYVISPDEVRNCVSGPIDNPDGTRAIDNANEAFVWSFVDDVIAKKANKGELIIVDATHSRSKAISRYKQYSEMGYRIIGIDFSKEISIDEVLKRNKTRDPVKFVSEEIVRSIHERCQTLEIPTWVAVIKPSEFKDHFTNNIMNFDEFDTINVFGDIHGCKDELVNLLGACGIDPNQNTPKTANVFVGDYFDRGYDVVGTFKILQELQKNNWVLFLQGNHEEPLRYYKEFIKDLSSEVQKWIGSILAGFAQKEQLLENNLHLINEIVEIEHPSSFFKKIGNSWDRFRYSDNLSPEKELRLYTLKKQIEANDVIIKDLHCLEEEAVKILQAFRTSSFKHWDAFVERLKKYPIAFAELQKFVRGYKLPTDLKKDPVYKFDRIKTTSLGTMKKFALSDIKYTEVVDFAKKCAQMFYGDFHGQRILITHAGLVHAPDKRTRTADMVRGVGSYDDAKLCMETFTELHPDIIQVHGHRNMESLPIRVTETTFNINGDVDQGLRAVTFNKNGTIEETEISPKDSTLKFFREVQLKKAKKFNAKKLTPEEEGKGLLQLFQDHQHIDVKKLPGDIAAINFTKKAFEKGVWDDITIRARGLFVRTGENLEKGEITVIARGYQKFFNVGEKFGFSTRDIRELAYPLKAFEKANGYLGLLSVEERYPHEPKWFFASKSTTEGDFALKFKEMVEPSLTEELKQKLIEDKVTLVFEVIEPNWDPHIEEYQEPELVLLEAIKNDINFEKMPYEELPEYIYLMNPQPINIREKKLVAILETFNEYWEFAKKANNHPLLSSDGIEGYVFEDSSEIPNMFKLKTDWYSFWKYMRSNQHRIISAMKKYHKRTGVYDIDKSTLIRMKQFLHKEEEFKVFMYMVELARQDFAKFENMGVIDIRNEFLKELTEGDKNAVQG